MRKIPSEIFFFLDATVNGLKTPNEGINQKNLKIWADLADNIRFDRI